MGQVLHDCAATTKAIRRAIQNSQESLRVLAERYGINPKTVAKWKKRGSATLGGTVLKHLSLLLFRPASPILFKAML